MITVNTMIFGHRRDFLPQPWLMAGYVQTTKSAWWSFSDGNLALQVMAAFSARD